MWSTCRDTRPAYAPAAVARAAAVDDDSAEPGHGLGLALALAPAERLPADQAHALGSAHHATSAGERRNPRNRAAPPSAGTHRAVAWYMTAAASVSRAGAPQATSAPTNPPSSTPMLPGIGSRL